MKAFNVLDSSPEHVFLTGKAGTGKSTLLRYFRNHTTKSVVVLAPTGVAAVNVEGQTIHSFFRFRPDITPETVGEIKMRKAQRKIYKNLEAIVIDEISMVRADLFDCIDQFLRINGPQVGEPFGGVQMILIGDLFQLPPVVKNDERSIFRDVYKSPYFFDSNVFKEIAWHFVRFDKIYRQKEEDFIRLLGSIRNNDVNFEQLKMLNDRYIPDFQPNHDDVYIYLTTTNAKADAVNAQQLRNLRAESYSFDGEISGKFEDKLLPTHLNLELKVGAQIMLLNNDSQGRWINGSIGQIVHIEGDYEMVGIKLATGESVEVLPFTWELFQFAYNEETERIESEVVGSFNQFPIKLAWAITIHKSQGKTFSNVVIDIGSGTFSHGQMYVALSRCTSLNGIILKRPIQKRDILLDSRITEFMDKLGKTAV